MEEEKKLASHSYIFLEGDTFRCSCGSENGTVHILKFADGSERKECDGCFIFDKEAEKAGMLDNPESFVPVDKKKAKKDTRKEESNPQAFSYIADYNPF